jgi:MerR family mercuric resistance operon transcriptional regulator
MGQITNSRTWLMTGEIAARTGVNLETVRYYERIGLLPRPPRSEGGHRHYGEEQVRYLNFIRRGRELGFTLDEIRALLRLAKERDQSCAEARDLAVGHLKEIRAKIADLRAMEKVLREMVARCADGTLPECPLIEALFRESPPRRLRPGNHSS